MCEIIVEGITNCIIDFCCKCCEDPEKRKERNIALIDETITNGGPRNQM